MHRPSHGTALVTGVTGFIGSRLAAALLREGYAVRGLARSGAGLVAGVAPFRGDLLDPASLAGIERGVDVVVHCASLLGKWGTAEQRLRDVNVHGALALLERFRGMPLRRYVHLSAGGVTGPVRESAVDETYPCRPATAYERTKYEGEQRVLERAATLGVPALVVRPTFTYGPGDPHKFELFRAVKRGRYGFIGGGQSVNHPVFVDDLVCGIQLAIERGRTGETYIIGGERPVTKRELACAIADALGVRHPSFNVPRWLASLAAWHLEWLGRLLAFEPILTRSRVMMMADNFGYSIAKARRELGYAPHVELREGVARTVRAYVEAGRL
jgi:dihydroflavonol-4-reductase